jgi:hypothetical protein
MRIYIALMLLFIGVAITGCEPFPELAVFQAVRKNQPSRLGGLRGGGFAGSHLELVIIS